MECRRFHLYQAAPFLLECNDLSTVTRNYRARVSVLYLVCSWIESTFDPLKQQFAPIDTTEGSHPHPYRLL